MNWFLTVIKLWWRVLRDYLSTREGSSTHVDLAPSMITKSSGNGISDSKMHIRDSGW